MNNKRWSLVILSVLLTILMLFNLGCTGSTPEEEKVMEEVVEILTEDDSEDSADISTADEPEEKEVEDTPIPLYSFEETYDYPPMASLDEFTNLMGLTDTDKQKLDVRMDIAGNNVWGGGPDVEGIPPEAAPFADIVFTARLDLVYEVGSLKIRPTSQFTCGYYNYDIPLWVVCPPGLNPTSVDGWYVLGVGFGEDVPIDHETHYATIAAAMIPDDDPTGLWVPMAEYPWDHFQNTKLWLMNGYQPDMGWDSQAYNSDWTETPVNFFTVFYRNLAVFFISAADMAVEYPAGRATVDWTNPDDWQGSFSGDVEGGDPTIDPIPWGFDSRVLFVKEKTEADHLPEGYTSCNNDPGCYFDNGDFSDRSSRVATCMCAGCAGVEGCECVLMRDLQPWDFQSPYSSHIHEWVFIAGPNEPVELNPDAPFRCTCVKKTGE